MATPKAIRPYTQDEYRAIAGQLGNVYREGERQLLKLLADGNLTDWRAGFLRDRLAQVQTIIAGLNEASVEWAGVHIPNVYQHSLNLGAQIAGLDPRMSAIHQEQVAFIQYSVRSSLDYANGGIGRSIEDAYRQASLQALQEGMVGGQTRREISNTFLADLKERGITSFVDKSGREWDMTSYAEMVARTNMMEADRTASLNQMREAGRDLVTVSEHGEPCELCEPWEGETLSLTGDTPGYATVAEAEAAGLMHPNCLHSYLPAAEESDNE